MDKKQMIRFVISLAACFAASGLGGIFVTRESITVWYAGMNRPAFTPPDWVFGPVWTVLYLLMAVSFFIIWDKAGSSPNGRKAIRLFLIQLALNAAWTPLFFGAHLLAVSFIEIILLWSAILATIIVFRTISSRASILLVPYLIWVGYASVLNGFLWHLNR